MYDPLKDMKLTPIGQNADGSGIFLDTNTNETISEAEATKRYGKDSSSAGFTDDDYYNTLLASLPA